EAFNNVATQLEAARREGYRLAASKQIRHVGFISAGVYGKYKEKQTIKVESMELLKTVRDEGRNAIISFTIDGGDTADVMLHDFQTDPVKRELIHADFYIVNMTEEMDVEVSITIEGEPVVTKECGILQQPMHMLQVRAKPRDIPEEIVVNVESLEIGDSISVSDVKETDKFEILDDEDATLVTILAPEEEEEEETEGTEEGLEP